MLRPQISSNQPLYDVIIVGSGPAGVHAAHPLIEAGLKVAIVDAGKEGLKIKSNIKIVQRFGKGGLSKVWPGICDFFNKKELEVAGLPTTKIQKEYAEISHRLGLKRPVTRRGLYSLPVLNNYRTASIVDSYKKFKNFTYLPNHLVIKIKDYPGKVEVRTKSNEIYGKYVILAAGSINTTRIVLQSFKLPIAQFLTKPNYIFVCLNFGKKFKGSQPGFLNRSASESSHERFFIQFYRPYSASFLRSMIFGGLIAADIRFPAFPSNNKYSRLDKGVYKIHFENTTKEELVQNKQISKIKKLLPSLGLLPLKLLKNRTSSHYAGGVGVDSEGKLLGRQRIYIADSAGWKALPAKPITLTIMANARRVGKNVLKKYAKQEK